jgi:hypothetical protein
LIQWVNAKLPGALDFSAKKTLREWINGFFAEKSPEPAARRIFRRKIRCGSEKFELLAAL